MCRLVTGHPGCKLPCPVLHVPHCTAHEVKGSKMDSVIVGIARQVKLVNDTKERSAHAVLLGTKPGPPHLGRLEKTALPLTRETRYKTPDIEFNLGKLGKR